MTPNENRTRSNNKRPFQQRWLTDHLMDAMRTEQRLLEALGTLIRQQRAAILAEDHESLDDTTFGIQRILQTLTEASRRSHMISAQYGGSERIPLTEMIESLGIPPTTQLLEARNNLREAAQLVEGEVRANREMLGEALATRP